MKIETKEIYKCDHCNKLYQIKRFAIIHEERCSKNPDNFRACFGCEHIEKRSAKVYIGIDEYYTCEPIYESKELLFCTKKNTFLYPPLAGHKGNYYTEFYGDDKENKPMPMKCEFRIDESFETMVFKMEESR